MPISGAKKRAGINSVEIGMRVLNALASLGDARPLSAIVNACGLSPSQTHRYLASLSQAGMVKQDANGDYDLGPGALTLGLSALARIDVFRVADDKLSTFCKSTGSTVLLAALGPTGPIIVRWYVGCPPVVTSLALGSVLSVLQSATGQVFMAFRPEREMEALIASELAQSTALDVAAVIGLKEKVRAEGTAVNGGILIPGLQARAYPIIDLQGYAVLCATLVNTASQAGRSVRKAADNLRDVCADISRTVGGHSLVSKR